MAARTAIVVQDIKAYEGKVPTFAAVDDANGMEFINDGRTILLVKAGVAGAGAVTVLGVQDDNRRIGNTVLTLANDDDGYIGSFPLDLYGQAGGKVFVDFAVADVQIAAIRNT